MWVTLAAGAGGVEVSEETVAAVGVVAGGFWDGSEDGGVVRLADWGSGRTSSGGRGVRGVRVWGEEARAGSVTRMHLTMAETEVSRSAAQMRARR
jgi:hypothetical protein